MQIWSLGRREEWTTTEQGEYLMCLCLYMSPGVVRSMFTDTAGFLYRMLDEAPDARKCTLTSSCATPLRVVTGSFETEGPFSRSPTISCLSTQEIKGCCKPLYQHQPHRAAGMLPRICPRLVSEKRSSDMGPSDMSFNFPLTEF